MRARSSSTMPFTSRFFSANDGEQAVQQLGVVEVAADRLVDARVLHLHRHDPPVGHDRPVDLADRRGGDRDRVPVEEQPLGLVAELLAHDLRARLGAIGGTSACSWPARPAPRAAGRRAMNDSIWPAFMMAPFICPSSRATSSAVRMANCSSSRASPPRRPVHRAPAAPRSARCAERQPPDACRPAEAVAPALVGQSTPDRRGGRDCRAQRAATAARRREPATSVGPQLSASGRRPPIGVGDLSGRSMLVAEALGGCSANRRVRDRLRRRCRTMPYRPSSRRASERSTSANSCSIRSSEAMPCSGRLVRVGAAASGAVSTVAWIG